MAFGKKQEPASTPVAEVPSTPAPGSALTPTTGRAGLNLAKSNYDEADVGAGFENMGMEDFAVPFLAILQKNSPQVEEGNAKFMPGAKAGMIINTVTGALYDGKVGLRFIPVHREHNYIEWVPRDEGGGFVSVYAPESDPVREALKKAGRKFGKTKINDNNDLVETFNLFGVVLPETGAPERLLLGFSSSQIGPYKRWMTRAQSVKLQGDHGVITAPLFAHVYRLRTEFAQNKKGTWYRWTVDFDGGDAERARIDKTDPLYEEAKQFRALLLSGAATAAYETASADDTGGTESGEGFEM